MDYRDLKKSGNVLLSHSLATKVPSTSVGLTSVFEMGTGVSPPVKLPQYIPTIMKYRIIQPEKKFIKDQAFGRLVPLSLSPYEPYTYGLSTS